MKRLLSVTISWMLVFALLIPLCLVSAFAESDAQSPVEGEAKFFESFARMPSTMGPVAKYKELYYHYTDREDESTLDWALVLAYHAQVHPMTITEKIGGRLLSAGVRYDPFEIPYCVYDVKKDAFYGLSDSVIERYDGLAEALQSLEPEDPVSEYGFDELDAYLKSLDRGATISHYRILAYRERESKYSANVGVEWALIAADCEPSAPSTDIKALNLAVKNKSLVSKEPEWPFRSKLMVCIPDGYQKHFYALDALRLSSYDGLEDAILSLDFDSVGLEVKDEYLYRERFMKAYNLGGKTNMTDLIQYRESEKHTDENGEIDWALIYACSNAMYPMSYFTVIDGRALADTSCLIPYDCGYGVYDVHNDRFCELSDSILDDYDGLRECIRERRIGKLMGDADEDDRLTVLDATVIQKCLAGIREFPESDENFYQYTDHYYTDYDLDGSRSVLDATKIQKHLASLA